MRHQWIRVCLRAAGCGLLLLACTASHAVAQNAPSRLVFTVGVPDSASSQPALNVSMAVEERGLAMWSGSVSDFGVAVEVTQSNWTLRGLTGMTTLPIDGQLRPNLRQFEIVRNVYATRSFSVAGGGGIREEWDGTRTLIGRVLAGSDLGSGRLQGSLVMERATSSPRPHDAADVVTTLGWSRRVGERVSLGVESIGQDLEGMWNPAEADGGAKLLVGPSVQAQSKHGVWSASLTAGPVVHSSPGTPPHPFGVFASANWMPALHR